MTGSVEMRARIGVDAGLAMIASVQATHRKQANYPQL
jgi:hypothetical protein